MASTINPPITTEVLLPNEWTTCPVCGLHYVIEGRKPDRRRCDWFLSQLDDN